MSTPPLKYVVFNRDQLYHILTIDLDISTIDKIKFSVLSELLYEGCTLNDVLQIFQIYAIDYHARRSMIDIKRSVINAHELPEEVSFVTCRAGEDPRYWDWYGRTVEDVK